MALGFKTGGRRPGTPNKATSMARKAIHSFIQANAHNLNKWLNSVAFGIRKIDPTTGLETSEYILRPNPAKAFEMLRSFLEFQVPKLRKLGHEKSQDTSKANVEIFLKLQKTIKI